jgi:DNA-binding IclR family transcriptional regulator
VKQRTGDVLRSADRLLRVLTWFTVERPTGTAAEIARDLEVAPATVRRLLALLETHRFVHRDTATGAYALGFAPVRLAAIARGADPLARAAQDELDRLQSAIGELVVLGILDGFDVVHLDTRESTFDVRVHPAVGRRVTADDGGATGAVLLAWLSQDDLVDRVTDEYGEGSAGERVAAMLPALEQVRRRGYAVNEGRAYVSDIYGVAAPIRASGGEPIAGLCLAAPTVRATKDRRREMTEEVLKAAATISSRLGWPSA